jgi:hypothetical protein
MEPEQLPVEDPALNLQQAERSSMETVEKK